ncbi:UDP-glucose:sterol glucosyltransferase [Acidisarcina polymorpha]|uniref:UDP-glucose:sterol glucosyltransferase n=1 Tax=Acidisarcina polymorpha TaxID=2211140 RepID=A0A2Z5G6Y1_9BACT|nr:nucleotide disphospho-sugar-binding domain-containing protein [Acidisarcina polymorpha]AXC14730.1 UDP-glucose:sterol glucosyltransferase [Acidisarcina polymorpha]
MPNGSKRIVLATIGSLGDLHPCLALALALRERGHRPLIASTEAYRSKVEALGLQFHVIRPDIAVRDPALMGPLMDMRRGPEVLLRRLILPVIRDTYEDLIEAVTGADLLIAGEIVFAAPLVAEKLRMRWVSAILSPFSFFSSLDPPVFPLAPSLDLLYRASPLVHKALLKTAQLATLSWWKPVRKLRRELGLRPGRNPIFYDKFSPNLTLALFSSEIARPQDDWPPNTIQPGYVYYDDAEAQSGLPAELSAFLDAGRPPIVFTLGSSAVHEPRGFFEESAAAAAIVKRRAVFLIADNPPPPRASSEMIAVPYASFSNLFPHAAAIVHQGGSGTTAQALRAGRPSLIMPCGFDQPDNAARVQRMGAGLTLSRNRYTASNAAKVLEKLLDDPQYSSKAEQIGDRLRAENGIGHACDAIEALFMRDAAIESNPSN